MRVKLAIVGAMTALFGLGPVQAVSAAEATCSRPESDAEALYILAGFDHGAYKYYWWQDTSLQVAIRAHPDVTEDYLRAVKRAIRTWNTVLQQCLGGQVSMTYIQGARSISQADIVVNLLPRPAGGLAFNGVARCGPGGCQNVMISTQPPPGSPYTAVSVEEAYRIGLHELGHALGLGHATNIESFDIMGYGGFDDRNQFVISQCDADALAYIWSWALNGTRPTRPTDPIFEC